MSTKQTWTVEGEHTMHCGGCAQTINFTLSQIPGVQRVKADHQSQQVEVETNDPEAADRIVAELNNLGYEVQEVAEDERLDDDVLDPDGVGCFC